MHPIHAKILEIHYCHYGHGALIEQGPLIGLLPQYRARPIYRYADIIGRYKLIEVKLVSAFITADL